MWSVGNLPVSVSKSGIAFKRRQLNAVLQKNYQNVMMINKKDEANEGRLQDKPMHTKLELEYFVALCFLLAATFVVCP